MISVSLLTLDWEFREYKAIIALTTLRIIKIKRRGFFHIRKKKEEISLLNLTILIKDSYKIEFYQKESKGLVYCKGTETNYDEIRNIIEGINLKPIIFFLSYYHRKKIIDLLLSSSSVKPHPNLKRVYLS